MIQVFGIPNCGSVKKARTFFESNQIEYEFIDFKKQAMDPEMLKHWMEQVDWTSILNKKGTSYRQLSEAQKASIQSADAAANVILANNSLIKRPVIVKDEKIITIGFDEANYQNLFL